MSIFDWFFGRKHEPPKSQPMVTVGVSSDDWLDWMLDELDERDQLRRDRKRDVEVSG